MSIRSRVEQQRFESSAQEAGVSLLVAAAHLGRELGAACEAVGITRDQYNVLRILRGALPGGYPRYEIARRLIDRAPDVTRLLDRLERQGLVERTRSAEDRRLSVSRISGEGQRLVKRLDPRILAVHERFAGTLSDRQRADLIRLCSALVD